MNFNNITKFKSSSGINSSMINLSTNINSLLKLGSLFAINENNQLIVYNDKDYLYSNGNNLILPTKLTYDDMIIKKSYIYRMKIKTLANTINKILPEILKGNTIYLKELYTNYYPTLVLYSMMAQIFNLSLEDKKNKVEIYNYKGLAEALNKINSNFYLYYYLFSQEKLIKLSKFNYYQIPLETPSSYLYFSQDVKDGNMMYDIMLKKDQDQDQAGGKVTDTDSMISVEDDYNKGFINMFSQGLYNNMIQEYIEGKLPVKQITDSHEFKIFKTSKMPPSLYNSLSEFYNYTTIQIVKKVIESIHKNDNAIEKSIYDKAKDMVNNIGVSVDNIDLAIYKNICLLVEELIQSQINIYIDNSVTSYYMGFINDSKVNILPDLYQKLTVNNTMNVNLTYTNIDIEKDAKFTKIINLYAPVMSKEDLEDKLKPFIVYPNDLTNTDRIKTKYGIYIDKQAITILIESNASPLSSNNEGLSAIYPIIKNFNYNIINELRNQGFDYRDMETEKPKEFVKMETIDNINNIIGNVNNMKLSSLLSNIDMNLYADTKAKIVSNKMYGNNVLLYLPESFNICSYLTLQYLSEHLLNINDNFKEENVIELFNLLKNELDINKVNKNHLGQILPSLRIPIDPNFIIYRNILNEKHKELIIIENNLTKIKKTIESYNNNITKIIENNKSEYKDLIKKKEELKKVIKNIANIDIDNTFYSQPKVKESKKIIKRYNMMELDRITTGYAWNKLLETNIITTKNHNLIPIYILMKEKELLSNKTIPSELIILRNAMKHLSEVGEDYFETSKYLAENKVLRFVFDTLEYLTKNIICTGIEYMMRRIMFTFFTKNDNNIDSVNSRIEYYLEGEKFGLNKSMKTILYEDISILLVKNSAEIYNTKAEENSHNKMTVREILTTYFEKLLKIQTIDENIVKVLKSEASAYFDTFVGRTILLWHVNMENIFAYHINNYRCLETLLAL